MIDMLKIDPELLVEYTDPIEGFKGWLAIDSLSHRLCAGGLRVQEGLTREIVSDLASTMTLKMRIAGIKADGAKAGIDYNPNSPGKSKALYRFLRAIRPYVLDRYSMGPDLNTKMSELGTITEQLGVPSIKMAIAQAQEMELSTFLERYNILKHQTGYTTVGNLRAGFGVASACLGVLEFLNIDYPDAKIVIQGFGGLGGAAAYSLKGSRASVIGLADKDKSLIANPNESLDIMTLLANSSNGIIPRIETNGTYGDSTDIFKVPCDVLVPAAVENVITVDNARDLQVKAIVCGANLAITPVAEKLLNKRGVIVIPDLVAGCGGSLSMDGLFGATSTPSAQDVLNHVDQKMRSIVKNILVRCREDDLTTREAALRICSETPIYPDSKPYGPVLFEN